MRPDTVLLVFFVCRIVAIFFLNSKINFKDDPLWTFWGSEQETSEHLICSCKFTKQSGPWEVLLSGWFGASFECLIVGCQMSYFLLRRYKTWFQIFHIEKGSSS